MSYQQFALIYDELMEDAPYDDWVKITQFFIKKYMSNVEHIVDLGCGTGEIAIRLAKHGYRVTGVDLSEEMLTLAQQKSYSIDNPQWICQDIRKLEGFKEVPLIVSYCDVLNYILEEDELEEVFQKVYQSLNEKGLFIFDIHSPYYVQHVLRNQTFTQIDDEVSFVWLCEEGLRPLEVIHDLTFFVQSNQYRTLYERYDEQHVQKTYPLSTYEGLLKKTGFHILDIFGDFIEGQEPGEEDHRIFFVCQK
ncbi:methyltransferase domain-containing protein [Bacillaceae bacterium S4-13-58]